MLGTGYFLKIAKINSQQEKPICPNRKNQFLQNTKNRQSAKINSRKNFVPHGIQLVFNNYSLSPNGLLSQQPMGPKTEWGMDSEAMRARGIIVLVKSNQLVKNIENKKLSFSWSLANPFLPPKSPHLSLLVGYNIQPSSSSTNQTAALIIDHQLDFTKGEYPPGCWKSYANRRHKQLSGIREENKYRSSLNKQKIITLVILSNDPGKVDSSFFCYAATVLSPHRNVLIFTQRMHKPT